MIPDLSIVFPTKQRWPGWPYPKIHLSSSTTSSPNSPSSSTLTLYVDPNARSDYLSDNPVFRAHLARPYDGWSNTLALKFAFRPDLQASLQHEQDVYQSKLKRVQGTAVPVCHGLYQFIDGSELMASCLVLDWWGECVDRPFVQLPFELRLRALARLHAIHRQGILHEDFAERNVLTSNGDVRIIDFDLVAPHECHCTLDFEHLDGHGQVQCEQLWRVCILMGIVS